MPSSLDLRQKLNTGHYGPAPTVNVIPELDGNRVKIWMGTLLQLAAFSYDFDGKLANFPKNRGATTLYAPPSLLSI